ncbi:unnamed protein product, partial [Prorocentrum cordatum]
RVPRCRKALRTVYCIVSVAARGFWQDVPLQSPKCRQLRWSPRRRNGMARARRQPHHWPVWLSGPWAARCTRACGPYGKNEVEGARGCQRPAPQGCGAGSCWRQCWPRWPLGAMRPQSAPGPRSEGRGDTAEAVGASELLGLQAVPPAEFHTRCMTFLNAVVAEAGGEPGRVQEVMERRCGGDAQAMLHRRVPSALAVRCRGLGARLVDHMQRTEAGQERDGDSRRLVSSPWDPPRVHHFYQAAAAWCYDVFGAHQNHSWDRLVVTPPSRGPPEDLSAVGPSRRSSGAAGTGAQSAWPFLVALHVAALLAWRR